MFSKRFALDMLERAVKTFAQAMLALLGAQYAGLFDVPWRAVLTTAALAAVTSVLTSLASVGAGSPNSASLLPEYRPMHARRRNLE